MMTIPTNSDRLNTALERLVIPLYITVAISLPFSVRIYFSRIDLEVIFPAEPLIGILFLTLVALFFLRQGRRSIDRPALRHPVVLLVVAWLAILTLSMLASDQPVVSMKALMVRSVYAAAFFLFPLCLSSLIRPDLARLLLVYGFALVPIILYSLLGQASEGYDRGSAGLAPFPFYVDHTSYAAALVFTVIMFAASAWRMQRTGAGRWSLAGMLVLTILGVVAIYLAYCRAAWLGALAVLLLLPLLHRGIGLRKLILGGGMIALCIALVVAVIVSRKGMELADSNATGAGLKESVLSLTNVTTDASNKERINRWKCAYRMFRDEPLLGHGVGMYQFTFLPYQRKEELTYISVTGPVDPKRVQRVWSASDAVYIRRNPQLLYCSGGTAHSEFMLALSESGLFAFLILVALVLATLRTGLRTYARALDIRQRSLLLGALLPLLAYFVHALFNNFLDDPKVAFPFWTALGLVVSLDLSTTVKTSSAAVDPVEPIGP